jgi:hypothetical protein
MKCEKDEPLCLDLGFLIWRLYRFFELLIPDWIFSFDWFQERYVLFKVCHFTWKEFQVYSVLFVLVYIDTLRIPLNGFYHTVRVGKFWFKLNVVNRCDLLILWFRRAIFLLNERFSLWDCLSFCYMQSPN